MGLFWELIWTCLASEIISLLKVVPIVGNINLDVSFSSDHSKHGPVDWWGGGAEPVSVIVLRSFAGELLLLCSLCFSY